MEATGAKADVAADDHRAEREQLVGQRTTPAAVAVVVPAQLHEARVQVSLDMLHRSLMWRLLAPSVSVLIDPGNHTGAQSSTPYQATCRPRERGSASATAIVNADSEAQPEYLLEERTTY